MAGQLGYVIPVVKMLAAIPASTAIAEGIWSTTGCDYNAKTCRRGMSLVEAMAVASDVMRQPDFAWDPFYQYETQLERL